MGMDTSIESWGNREMCDIVISKIASECLQRGEGEIKADIDKCGQEDCVLGKRCHSAI